MHGHSRSQRLRQDHTHQRHCGAHHAHHWANQIHGETVVQNGKSLVGPAERGVSMVFQDYALFPSMTVAQNVAFGIQDQPDSESRVQRLLKLAEIESLADRFPAQLSGGQQQRVALLRALAPRPKLLLLDEPFANVDSHLKQRAGPP